MKRFVASVALLACASAGAQQSGPPDLSIDLNAYPYQHSIDDDVDFTALINARLPARFSYFSWTNFRGVVTSGSAEFVRSEQNLRYSMSSSVPLDLNLQGMFVDGSGNDYTQIGIGWRIHNTPAFESFFSRIHMIYRLTFHLRRFGTDDDVWQMQHAFRVTTPQLSNRVYLAGWMKQTFGGDKRSGVPSEPIIGEAQFGVRLWRQLHAVAEYRINQNRPSGSRSNLAVGLEYKLRFDF